MSTSSQGTRRILVETVLCFAVLSVLLLLVFGPAVFELAAGGTPGMFDIKHYFVPMSFVLDTAIASGELPMWNPLTFCGAPFAANPQSATFYPPHFVRSLLTPGPTPLHSYYGLILLAALQSLAAGVGVYWLARSHGLGYVASLAAAATFIFSAAFTRRVAEYHFIPALMWVPFVLLVIRKLLRETNPPRRLFWAVGGGMLIGWSLLSGFVQIQVHIALLYAAYWLLDRALLTRFNNYAQRASIPVRFGADLLYGGIIAVTACVIAAALLIPGAEFAQLTYRAGTGHARIVDYGLDWAEIRNGLFGSGNVSPYRAAMLSAYALGFIGLFGKRKREAIVYALLFLGLLDCSLGPPFPMATLVNAISPIQIAHPNRVLVQCCLPLGFLVGFGIQALGDRAGTVQRGTIQSIAIVAVCVAIIGLSGLAMTDVVILLLLGLSAAALLSRWFPIGRMAMPLACVVLLVESVAANNRYLPEMLAQSGAIDIRSESTKPAKFWTTNSRTCDLAPNRHLYTLQPAINGYDPLYLGQVWQLLAPWYYNWNYQRILQAHDTVRDNPYPYSFIKRPFWLVRQYVNGSIPKTDPHFPPTTTAYIETEEALIIPEVAPDAVLGAEVSRFESIALGQPEPVDVLPFGGGSGSPTWDLMLPEHSYNHAVLRLAIDAPCPGTLRVSSDDGQSADRQPVYWATIDEERLGPSEMDIPLPDVGRSSIRVVWDGDDDDCGIDLRDARLFVDGDDEDPLIQITERTFNIVRVEVGALSAPRVLAFIDADYPGWNVSVDGQPGKLLNVNNAFKGVELTEGEHSVEFAFRSPALRLGMVISIVGTYAILIGLFVAAVGRLRRHLTQ